MERGVPIIGRVLWRNHPEVLKFEREVQGYLSLLENEAKARERAEREAEEEQLLQRGLSPEEGGALPPPPPADFMTSVESLDEERSTTANSIKSLWELNAEASHIHTQLLEETLCSLQQKMELELLQIERVLDRERIIALLKQTAPRQKDLEDEESVDLLRKLRKEGDVQLVDSLRISQLQTRCIDAGRAFLEKEAHLRHVLSAKLSKRADRERGYKSALSGKQTTVDDARLRVREQEDKLLATTKDLLKLRHTILVARRTEAESIMEESQVNKEHIQNLFRSKRNAVERASTLPSLVDGEVKKLVSRLKRQTLLSEEMACMLKEQNDKETVMQKERIEELSKKLAFWTKKRKTLSRLNNSELEAFTRASDELKVRHQRNTMKAELRPKANIMP